ncbi:MAG: alkaline phosphatase family protein, partial [Nitrospinae bacterium]|nr:alkaline phosphatase family protein [Nitrospinota bacterium]
LTENLVKILKSREYNLIICNYANPDMVGHTGVWEAALKAVEVIEECVTKVVKEAETNDYSVFITADHGNIEVMCDENNNPVTSHSMGKSPFYYIGKNSLKEQEGALKDIAPSILYEMGIDIPVEMTGKAMIA